MSIGGWFAAKKIKEVAGDFEANPGRTAAEFIVKMNPDLEIVESDDDAGTITVYAEKHRRHRNLRLLGDRAGEPQFRGGWRRVRE